MFIPSLNIVPKTDINGPESRIYDSRDTIFVAPDGKDNYLGSNLKSPVKSLSAAKDLIQKMKSGSSRSLKVEFLSGSYEPKDVFFNNDEKYIYFKHYEGGTDDYKLVFKAHDKTKKPLFKNSTIYTGFLSSGSHWKIKINQKDIRKCNLFGFVNGVRSIPARFPKYGALTPETETIHTYDGTTYRKVKDSSGFIESMFSYLSSGGDSRKTGVMSTSDFRFFTKTNVSSISSSLPDASFEANIFYVTIPSANSDIITGSWQIFANQSDIIDPTVGSPNDYDYEPSNLPVEKVCTVKGENTIIKEGREYFFYYKPSDEDISTGIENAILETFKYGNPDMWTTSALYKNNSGVFDKVNKSSSGYTYSDGDDIDNSNHVGFYFINPNNLKFEDLEFEHCVCPMTLNTPVSSDQFNNLETGLLKEFTNNVSISGCSLKYNFGSGIAGRFVGGLDIYKNLIYSTESVGISFAAGHGISIKNNIVKSFQLVDTRKSESTGQGGIKVLGTRNKPVTLSAVNIENNDCGYGGNVMDTIAATSLSARKNNLYNAGFGANSDMAIFYQGFTFTSSAGERNYLNDNIIKNSRSYKNSDFLGNLVYYDGGSKNIHAYNNLIYNGQTGFYHTSIEDSPIYNNVIYDTKFASIVSKNNSGNFPENIRYWNNIFVPGLDDDGAPSYVSRGWLGTAHSTRTISNSPRNIKMINTSDESVKTLKAISSWNGRVYYMSVAGGGASTLIPPTALFNGTDWIIGTRNFTVGTPEDGVKYILSAHNSFQYDNIWDVPEANWNYVDTYTESFYENFSRMEMDDTRNNTSIIPMSSDNNLFWSLADEVVDPEDNADFFLYNGSVTTFDQITSYAIPGTPRSANDNSLLSIFGEPVLIEQGSILGDPLFIDPENGDFSLSEFSPASSINFNEVDFSDVGVYNTSEDPYWRLSATSIIAQPVIYGHKEWASYTVLPFPFDPLQEYDVPQH